MELFFSWAVPTALFFSWAVPTAPVFSWSVPTLLRGTATATAATLVPPSAISSASEATTIDGDGLTR